MHGRFVPILLALLLTGCGPWPATHSPEPGDPGAAPVVLIRGRPLPVDIVLHHAEREKYALVDGHRTTEWRSPADLLYRLPPPAGVLYAYPAARARDLAVSDSLGRKMGALFLTAGGRILRAHAVKLGVEWTVLESGGEARFVLFLPEPWFSQQGINRETLIALPSVAARGAQPEYQPLPDVARIRVGGVPVTVEVADTRDERGRGLMYRDHVPAGTGMLFLYPEPSELSFWMLNTRVALDCAYIDGEGVIRKIVRLKPSNTRGESSDGPVQMVLEVPGGWFEKMGIDEGDRLALPARIEVLGAGAEGRLP